MKKKNKKSSPTSKDRRKGIIDPIYSRLAKRGLLIDRRKRHKK